RRYGAVLRLCTSCLTPTATAGDESGPHWLAARYPSVRDLERADSERVEGGTADDPCAHMGLGTASHSQPHGHRTVRLRGSAPSGPQSGGRICTRVAVSLAASGKRFAHVPASTSSTLTGGTCRAGAARQRE